MDLTPTLIELAGLEPSPDWAGLSLLSARPERVLYGFEHSAKADDSVFVLADEHKVLLAGEPGRWERLERAYDLARDPEEQCDLLATDARWPAELREHGLEELTGALRSRFTEEPVDLDAAKAAELRALGY